MAEVQNTLQSLCGTQLVDLHVADLLNDQLPSHHDYTSQYDVLVFRRLGTSNDATPTSSEPVPSGGSPPVLRRVASRIGAR